MIMKRNCNKTRTNLTVTRHFYSPHRQTFETSLDVYQPTTTTTCIVVLVVGSCWLGHSPWIYTFTSWWNSTGPRSIVETMGNNSICIICVRHRGAFFHVPPIFSTQQQQQESYSHYVSLGLCIILVLSSMLGQTIVASLCLGVMCLWMWLYMVGQEAASFPDMQNDVEQAILWIQQHKMHLCGDQNTDIPIYLGGYSSGAHVAISVLQHSRTVSSSMFHGILLISGVLAVRPEVGFIMKTNSDVSQSTTRWFTDGLLRIVFGPEQAKTIPSPIAHPIPALPHLMIVCTHEVVWGRFDGLLNVFFCSRDYAEQARQQGIHVDYYEISSNHWYILSHPTLSQIISTKLLPLVNTQKCRKGE